jgi:excisionase family DNA binding protein
MSVSERWLTISEAAEVLGVHPTTLRRWADQGKVEFRLTAGGHRRFAVTALDGVLSSRRKLRVVGGLEQQWADRALEQTRRELGLMRTPHEWPLTLSVHDRDAFRKLSRRLLGLLMQYISLGEGGEGLLQEGERVGRTYAAHALELGIGLSDLMWVLFFFRDNMIDSALEIPQMADLRPEANQRIVRRMNELLNNVQLAIVNAYYAGQRPPQADEAG